MNIYFQWVSSEINTVSVLKNVELDDGVFYLNFKDGRRCNQKFAKAINENCDDSTCVIQIEDPSKLWTVKSEYIGAKPERWEKDKEGEPCLVELAYKGKLVKKYMPPVSRRGKPYFEYDNLDSIEEIEDTINEVVNENVTQEDNKTYNKINEYIPINKIIQKNPIHELCEKSKKIEAELNCNINLNIPSISLYNVISESFENGANEFLNYIMENIDTEEIKKNIKECIYNLYTNNDKE